ncbi:uncharacterized protein N7487_006525 [Penicillium crustosum]|uniref:uncharacterized protein n=1 Tax=Penicillium crustosum TaxID=36656 RepID=UPI0023A3F7AC|nr:uncharacterized protein N7487_006525 [Penicillium crustosum]KAJ5412166.1 hypothetical protein N7487_006525 [Penicillium crustosum]
MFTLVMLDNDLGTREIPDVSTARSHLYPSPFNIMTELFAVLVPRYVLNESLALTNTITEH